MLFAKESVKRYFELQQVLSCFKQLQLYIFWYTCPNTPILYVTDTHF